jgi:ketosteroid isomerase-like protein
MSNAERLAGAMATVFTGDETTVDEALIERMIAALAPIADAQVTTVMAGPDESFSTTHEGVDGIREAWADWLDSFAEVRFEIEGIEEVGENVLTLGRQIGKSRQAGVEIEQPSAAVWKFRDGKLRRVEFHLDRDRAYESLREPA